MLDRITFAVIGFVFGSLLAGLGWFLYGIGMSGRLSGASIDPELMHWIQYVGGAFAALGFLFKDRVGSAVGDVFAAIFNYEGGRDSRLNWWQALFILAITAAAIWALLRSTHAQ
jgi:hypothetical protein